MARCRLFTVLPVLLLLTLIPAIQSDAVVQSNDHAIGGVFFISYQYGESEDGEYAGFYLRRAYLTAEKTVLPYMDARITLDTNQDMDGDGRGDMEVRIKYAYAKFHFPDYGFFNKQSLEVGIVHAPWLDFEEHVNYYRMRERMFIERAGVINSADFGVTYATYLGGELDDDFKKTVNSKYAGRYGSMAFGVYNGGGYHAVEENTNTVFEARLTVRPLPDTFPGLQLSGFGIVGKGNGAGTTTNHIPDWNALLGMLSYEHQYFTVAAQYLHGLGNQNGEWVEAANPTEAVDYEGHSFFVELKPTTHWRLIGGMDAFDPDLDISNDHYSIYYGGVGYDFGNHNLLLFDYDAKDYAANSRDTEFWYQLTLQVKY